MEISFEFLVAKPLPETYSNHAIMPNVSCCTSADKTRCKWSFFAIVINQRIDDSFTFSTASDS